MLKGSIQSFLRNLESGVEFTDSSMSKFYVKSLSYEWRLDEKNGELIGRDVLRDFDVVRVSFSDIFSVEEFKVLIQTYETKESKERREKGQTYSRAPVIKKKIRKKKPQKKSN